MGSGAERVSPVGGCAPHTPIPDEHAHGRVVDARDTSQGGSGPPTHPRIFSLWGLRPHAPAGADARVAAIAGSGRADPSPRAAEGELSVAGRLERAARG